MFKKILFPISVFAFIFLYTLSNYFPIFFSSSKNLEIYKGNSSQKIYNLTNIQSIFTFKAGEGFYVDSNNFDINEFLKNHNAQVVFIEKVESGTSYYCFSTNIYYFQPIRDKIINLHIFISEKTTKIGSPIIYGGY